VKRVKSICTMTYHGIRVFVERMFFYQTKPSEIVNVERSSATFVFPDWGFSQPCEERAGLIRREIDLVKVSL
jgi:hypothetical protein